MDVWLIKPQNYPSDINYHISTRVTRAVHWKTGVVILPTHYWWHRRMSLWQPALPLVAKKLATRGVQWLSFQTKICMLVRWWYHNHILRVYIIDMLSCIANKYSPLFASGSDAARYHTMLYVVNIVKLWWVIFHGFMLCPWFSEFHS